LTTATYDPHTGKIVLGWLLLSEEDAVWALDLMTEEMTVGLRAGQWNPKLADRCRDFMRAIATLREAKKNRD